MRPHQVLPIMSPAFPKRRTDGNPWGEVQEILCPANWLCPARAPQALQLLQWRRRGVRTSPGTEGGCAVFRALLTYCLLGTSGLGLQFLSLFPPPCKNVCFPQKGTKVPFLQLARTTRVVLQGSGLQAQTSPSADCRSLALQPVLTWPVRWPVAS